MGRCDGYTGAVQAERETGGGFVSSCTSHVQIRCDHSQYPEGTVCEVEIVGLTTFGAFAKIIDGIDGLIHVSQISNDRIEKPEDVLSVGQKVSVKITAIDFDKKRISLSMKAVDDVPETTEEE